MRDRRWNKSLLAPSSFYQISSPSQELNEEIERNCFFLPSHCLPILSSLHYTHRLTPSEFINDKGRLDTTLGNSTSEGPDLAIL